MRNLLTIATMLSVLGCGGSADDAVQEADAAAVEDVVLAFFDALENMDFQALDATVTPDFELVEDTLVMDLSGFVEYLRPFETAGATISYEFSDFNTEVQGPVAWTRYRNRAVLEMNSERTRYEWLESAVLTRGEDGWRIDRLQSAPVRIQPEGG